MTTAKGNVLERNKSEITEKSLNGICLTCRHSATCMYAKNAASQINDCEEFEVEEKIQHAPASNQEKAEASSKRKFMGLCANCENRETCTFDKGESGVWHCEEYR